jgi:16S rRNA processing protein RimM
VTRWPSTSTSSTDPPGMALLEVGRIVKPHGLRGEVIVQLVTDRVERLDPGTTLESPVGPLRVEHSRPHQNRWIVGFEGVGSRTAAEALHGVVLEAAPLDDPGTLWIHELIGSDVYDRAGAVLGRVTAVEANPASDLLVLGGGGLIPLRFVVEHGPGRVVVDIPLGLLE